MKTFHTIVKNIGYILAGILCIISGCVLVYKAFGPQVAGAQTVVPVNPWITSSGKITQRVASTPIKITGVATGTCLSLDGSGVLTTIACGGAASFPFTAVSYGVSTSTTVGFLNGLLSVGSTTINGNSTTTGNSYVAGKIGIATSTPGQGALLGVNGSGFFNGTVYASNFYDTALSGTNCVSEVNGLLGTANCVSSIASANGTLTVSSPTGGVTLTYTGLATTSQPSSSNLLTSNGSSGVYGTATSTLTASGPLTGSFTQIGSGGTLGCTTASAGVAGCLNSSDWSTFNGKENVLTFTTPLIRTANTVNWVGLATTSQPASSNLLVSNGLAGVYGVATSSETCASGISCTAFNHIGSGGAISLATINAGVLGATLNGAVPTSQATSSLYGASTGGMVLGWDNASGGIKWVATSTTAGGVTSVTATAPIFSSGGATPNLTWAGLATTSALTQGQLLYNTTGGNGVASVATTTLTGTAPIAFSQPISVIGGSASVITCAVATASVPGCLAAADFTTFAAKTSWPWTINAASVFYGQISNSTTTEMHYGAAGYSLTASTTAAFNIINTGSSTPTAFANAPIVIAGNNANYTQAVIQNLSSGANASSLLAIHNNLGTSDSIYYGEIGINSSGYNQSAFASQWPNSVFFNASDGQLLIGTASTTNPFADLIFFTGGTASSSIRLTVKKNGFIGIGTSTPTFASLSISTTTAPQLSLGDGGNNPAWTLRSIAGSLYFSTSSLTVNATSTNASIQIDKNGKTSFLDVIHNWFGVVSPTRALSLQVGTTTTWTATTSGAYIAQVVAPFPGTIRRIKCSLDASFLGVNIQIGGSNIAPSYFVASTTVGTITPTATNTFTEGQVITLSAGTTTTATTQRGSCTLYVTETP